MLAALALVAAGCSNGGPEAGDPLPEITSTTSASTTSSTTSSSTTTTTRATTTTTTLAPPALAPLNGLPVEDEETLERRVIAVKVDNHCDARPQSGLQEAEAIFELPVEGAFTRFIALFHHTDSAHVGPIRSGRPTDSTLLRPLGATFAISGGQPWVLNRIASDGVRMLGEGEGTFRIGNRRSPHNLYGDTSALREEADRRGYPDLPPADLFEWGEFSGTERATSITVPWHSNNVITWEWERGRYQRSVDAFDGCEQHGDHEWVDEDGDTGQVAADTLVFLFGWRYIANPPGQGSAVPAVDLTGEGRMVVFAEGRVIEGTWARDAITDTFVHQTESGDPLTVPAGVAWISIFPSARDIDWE